MVDDVLVKAYRQFVKDAGGGPIKARLIQLAREQLDAVVKESKSWRRRTPVRTEQDIPDVPPSEWVVTLGDERLDFYEPDEDLKLEDILPDLDVPIPEEEAERRELRGCVGAALAGLPREWRRALLLRYVDGLTGVELARALGKPPRETERVLDHARPYLRERLLELGCRFKGSDGG